MTFLNPVAPTAPPVLPEARAWAELHRSSCEPYRRSGRFAWHFARGKLGRDPVFRQMLHQGWLRPHARVIDVGCGQGLLASLLSAVDAAQRDGRWPAQWAAAPAGCTYLGIEMMPRDVARAESALAGLGIAAAFRCADMCTVALPPCDAVVILDVLHYVDHDAQRALLEKVRAALAPRGRLLMRVGDMAQQRRYALSQWVDWAVTRVRGHRAAPTHGRTVSDWCALLQQLGFAVEARPMSRGTPFANVLLVADLHGGEAS